MGQHTEWTDDQTEQLRQAIARGLSYRLIASTMGVEITVIGYRVKKYGLIPARNMHVSHRNHPWTSDEIATIERMVAEGATTYQIGKTIGRSARSVVGFCKQRGLKTKYRGWWEYQRDLLSKGMKQCTRCQQVFPLSVFERGVSRRTWCLECERKWGGEYISKNVATLLAERLRTAREKVGHRTTQVEVHITLDYLLDLWKKQGGKCYYTGLDMSTEYRAGHRAGSKRISIDRVDSSKGYIQGNVVLCCDTANMMKNTMSVTELKEWCRLVVAHAPE